MQFVRNDGSVIKTIRLGVFEEIRTENNMQVTRKGSVNAKVAKSGAYAVVYEDSFEYDESTPPETDAVKSLPNEVRYVDAEGRDLWKISDRVFNPSGDIALSDDGKRILVVEGDWPRNHSDPEYFPHMPHVRSQSGRVLLRLGTYQCAEHLVLSPSGRYGAFMYKRFEKGKNGSILGFVLFDVDARAKKVKEIDARGRFVLVKRITALDDGCITVTSLRRPGFPKEEMVLYEDAFR